MLRKLPTGEIRGSAIATDLLPHLVSWLGFEGQSLRYDYLALGDERPFLFDAAIVDQEDYPPLLIFDVKYALPARFEDEWVVTLDLARDKVGALASLVITNGYVGYSVAQPGMPAVGLAATYTTLQIANLTTDDLEEMRSDIGKDALTLRSVERRRRGVPEGECSDLLTAVRAAATNDDKKNTLEQLAEFLFGKIPGFRIKRRNLRTRSSEIDLVVESSRTDRVTFFDDYGRYALIECKNWASPVGAKEVRDFVMKLLKTRIRLGVLVTRLGVTGAHGGEDALREIQFCHDTLNTSVIVLSDDDLEAVCAGADFMDLLDDKLDRLRFDLREND